ncbi:MAG: YegP family protein [Saprospiraceae bacterium]|nr:YegP family protein [Saprospiraceae bacterium]
MGKYVVRKSVNDQYWWVLKAGNGETLIKSETYTTKQNCLNGIASSKVNVSDQNFNKLTSARLEPYFTQKAGNNQILGTSEMYSSNSARDAGIESVKRNAPSADIEDLT